MKAQQKIENKFNAMSAEELFEVLRGLNNDEREEAFILVDIATDIYMAKVSDKTFCYAMEILESELNY